MFRLTYCFLLVLLLNGAVAVAQESQPQEEPSTTLKVDVRLVNVFVTVTDANGAPIGNLKMEDFQLLEDNTPEKIAVFGRESELPLSIALLIDASLSARKELQLELESARRFVKSILRPIDAVSLIQFSEYVDELVPFTSDMRRLDRGISRVKVGSATALYDAIYLAAESLVNRKGRKVIVVITDGGDTVSSTTFHQALREAQQSEAIVYSIIVVPVPGASGRNTGGEHALIEISNQTGGKHYYATEIARLDQAFQQISDELRTQYLLAYYPSRRLSDSSFREIEVQVKGPEGVKARHRKGYYTTPSK